MVTREFRPLATGEALDVAINVTKRAFAVLAPFAVATVGTSGLGAYAFFTLGPGFQLAALISLLTVPFALLVMCVVALDTYFGRTATVASAIRSSLRPTALVIGYLVFGASLMGLVAGVLPGLVILAWAGIAVPIVIEEHGRLFDTIARTWRLTRGVRGTILAFYLWFALILGVLTAAVWITAFGLEALGVGLDPSVVLWPLAFVTAAAAIPIFPVGLAVMYVDARVRNEAFDLQQRLEAIRTS
ncbi:MAG: hypothetical protein KJN81_04565 [Acidimicrobiia bacterium]|nr:hypothetical protein [Acidimicrobiia bacterium]NNL27683.1 hypothetical protein [Acidimicrobiia bacterium]